jgi:acyl-coenzyme A thioesterase PaaI-like protein
MPTDYIEWPYPSPVLDAIGGLRQHRDDPLLAGFKVDQHKVNGRGFLHAGVIATLGDVAIGHALGALAEPGQRYVTVNLSCDLLGVAHLDDWVDITISPTRSGRRLAAGAASFHTDRPIATVTALFMPARSDA